MGLQRVDTTERLTLCVCVCVCAKRCEIGHYREQHGGNFRTHFLWFWAFQEMKSLLSYCPVSCCLAVSFLSPLGYLTPYPAPPPHYSPSSLTFSASLCSSLPWALPWDSAGPSLPFHRCFPTRPPSAREGFSEAEQTKERGPGDSAEL